MALNINGTTGISGVDGSVSAPALTGTDSNTGITFPSADTIKFSTGGVERISITNSGISGTGILTSGGKFLQVVQNSTTTRLGTSSSSFVATSHFVTITPTAASSKIFITHTGEANSQSSGNHVYITVYRSIAGGTYTEIAPHGSVTNQGMSVIRSADARLQVPFSINFVDDPSYSVGNAITYKLYVRCPEGNLIEIPSSNDSNAIVNIAREIAA